jgi:hypothetical protein
MVEGKTLYGVLKRIHLAENIRFGVGQGMQRNVEEYYDSKSVL